MSKTPIGRCRVAEVELRRRSLRAFTLVELLIVMAIMGVLVGLLLPAIQAARSAARRAECANQMRQFGLAIHHYAQTHGDRLPRTYHAGAGQSWMQTLAPFVEHVDSLRICPDDPHGATRLQHSGTSYVANQYLFMQVDGSVSKMGQLKATSRTIALFEGADARDPTSSLTDHAHPADWFKPGRVQRGWVWAFLEQDIQTDRHQMAANYLFMDGHVEPITQSVIRTWADEGYNFALPDQAYVPR